MPLRRIILLSLSLAFVLLLLWIALLINRICLFVLFCFALLVLF